MFGGDLSRLFSVKCMLNIYPFKFIIIFTLSVTFSLAYLVRIIESPVWYISQNARDNLVDFRSFENSVWYILITMCQGITKIIKFLSWVWRLLSLYNLR